MVVAREPLGPGRETASENAVWACRRFALEREASMGTKRTWRDLELRDLCLPGKR